MKIFSQSLAWCGCPGRKERAGTDTNKKKKDEIDLEGLATRLFEKGSTQEDAERPQNLGDYTENNVIMLKASANTHPEIAEGLVTNIWFESTQYLVKSREILAWINKPFVVYFRKSQRIMSQNIISSD